MRDMTTGGDITVGGDFIVNDQSQEYKPLYQCTNDELLHEEEHRRTLLHRELFSKLKAFAAYLAALAFAGAVYFTITDVPKYFEYLIGIAGVLVAFIQAFGKASDVEEVAQIDLRTIDTLLRMRGARR